LTSPPTRYLYSVPPALGYQPRTTAAKLLLINLTVLVPSPYVTVPTPLTGWPWDYTRLGCIGRLRNAHGSLPGLDYPFRRQIVTSAFHRVTPAYSPKRLSGTGESNPEPLGSEPRMQPLHLFPFTRIGLDSMTVGTKKITLSNLIDHLLSSCIQEKIPN
jgi:hypothetical protein